MRKHLTTPLILTSLILSMSNYSTFANDVNLNNIKLQLNGGLSTTEFVESKAEKDESSSNDLKLTDAVLELSTKDGYGGIDVAIGSLLTPTVLNSVEAKNQGNFGLNRDDHDKFGLLWGYVSASPFKNLEIDAGILPTNVGYELAPTYQNPNITFGLVWNSQPFIYKGIRATYNLNENIKIYGEYDKGNELNGNSKNHAFAVGSIGSIKDINYTVTYFDYGNYKNLVDFTLGYTYKNVQLGINGDYQWLDSNSSKKGYGIALYVIPQFGKFSIPIRTEYVKDKDDSGIYGFNNKGTYSFTLTPTYKLSEHTTIRAEYSYVKSNDDNAFNGSDHKGIASLQLSFTF